MSEAEAKQRVALVTGAGKGLGAAFARALAADGLAVMVNNRQREEAADSAAETVAAIEAAGGRAAADRHDVCAAGAAGAMVAATVAAFGGLDVLVLNAGITGPVAKADALDEAVLREVMETNFFANTALVRAALPQLRARRAARIVFISSTAGLHGLKGRPAYAASKGALNGYALSLADELRRDGIGVNVLMPYAATPMTAGTADGLADLLAPEAVGPALSWLAGVDCDVTGEIWVAGGGVFRRASAVESPSIPLGGHADFGAGRRFRGAEAAFADLLKEASNDA
ncbi:MAG: SDR family NAD(P)-dependent oxidoreductase [Polymorphobacter sp.]|uniref:SDR family NAD(P)-dependent oxidoreductase n=1 Tax=Polymorphobacter sp. TaxID=1909290 RepID=UPI003A849AC8